MEKEHTLEQAVIQAEEEMQGQQDVLRDQPEGESTDNEQDKQTEQTLKQQEGDESVESGA